jgi:hypothetical protein
MTAKKNTLSAQDDCCKNRFRSLHQIELIATQMKKPK